MVETKHELAGKVLDQLLGGIVAVNKAAQLDKHERALSLDGWLKDPPRRVKLAPEKELTLGEEGLRRLRDMREAELRETDAVIEEVRQDRDDLRAFLNRGMEWHLDRFTVPEGADEVHLLPKLRKELGELQATWDLLATPDNVKAMGKPPRGKRHAGGHPRAHRQPQNGHHRLRSRQITPRGGHPRKRDPGGADAHRTAVLARLRAWRSRGGNHRPHGCRAEKIHLVAQIHRNGRRALLQLETRAREARRLRDEQRREMVAAHPDLSDALDAAAEDNTAFDQRRAELETHELERFKAAAEEARREWEDRLQHQVLDVLREKLAEADRTKRELNRAMDHEIGGWRYQLTSRADKAHTAIWTLVEKGLPSGGEMELFNATAPRDIERAKAELMAAIDAADNPEDKRHQRMLDYRYYHHWDIEAKPAGRGEAAAISLNKSAKKQSGGENQAPFFVATLAAFRRVYDLGRREEQQNLGLVVMDEAFSKLSGDRIDDCLALARNFGLQLIMAFPEDRLPTMFQHADTVVQCRVERSYDEETEQVRNIENWVVRVEGSRLAELME